MRSLRNFTVLFLLVLHIVGIAHGLESGQILTSMDNSGVVMPDYTDSPPQEKIITEVAEMKRIHLRVITFNIHNGINWQGSFVPEAIIQFLAGMNADLIGLQEVGRFWPGGQPFDWPGMAGVGLKMFPSYAVSLERAHYEGEGYFGNLILSKHPLVRMWAEKMPGMLEQRSFLHIRVWVGDILVNFITTHLGLSEEERLLQAHALLAFVAELDGPVLIAGDFNAPDSDPAVQLLKERFNDLQAMSACRGQGTFRTKSGYKPVIDFIFASPEFELLNLQVIETDLSDHYPVVAEVGLWVGAR